jgi:hypothetical protein
MEMFDEIAVVRVAPDGEVEATLVGDAAQEMENAVAEMTKAYRDFRDADGPGAAHAYSWWRSMMWLSCAENRLKEAFLGRDRSPRSVAQYHRFRMDVIYGRKLRADA